MKTFKLDYLSDYQDEFTLGYELFSGMEPPKKGEVILAVLDNRKINFRVVSEPELLVNRGALVCTMKILRLDKAEAQRAESEAFQAELEAGNVEVNV